MGNRHLSGQGRSQDFSKGGAKIFSTPKAALFLRRVSRASPCFPIFSQFIILCGTIQITDLLHLGPVTVGKKDSGKGGLARGPNMAPSDPGKPFGRNYAKKILAGKNFAPKIKMTNFVLFSLS